MKFSDVLGKTLVRDFHLPAHTDIVLLIPEQFPGSRTLSIAEYQFTYLTEGILAVLQKTDDIAAG